MASKLRNVKLNEISFVGKGDNPEADVVLLKMRPKGDGSILKGKDESVEVQNSALEKWMNGNRSLLTKDDGEAMTFEELANDRELRDKLWQMCYMLEDSLSSITHDDSVTDKASLIQTSIEQFKTAVTNLTKGEETMDAKLKKELEDKVTELEKSNAELTATVETLKADATCPECGASIKKGSCEKGCGKVKKSDDEDIYKGLPEGIVKKMKEDSTTIAKMQDESLTREFVAKAAEVTLVGKADVVGDVLKSIAKHSTVLANQVLDLFKTASARIAEGDLLKEAGSSNSGSTTVTAYDKIVAKAVELRKACPELSEAKAFTKVYDSDEELRTAYLKERG